jgi:hypothetical protein
MIENMNKPLLAALIHLVPMTSLSIATIAIGLSLQEHRATVLGLMALAITLAGSAGIYNHYSKHPEKLVPEKRVFTICLITMLVITGSMTGARIVSSETQLKPPRYATQLTSQSGAHFTFPTCVETGQTFSLSASITNGFDIYCWGMSVQFWGPLQLDSAMEGAFLSTGYPTIFTHSWLFSTFYVSECRKGDVLGAFGDGIIVFFNFTAPDTPEPIYIIFYQITVITSTLERLDLSSQETFFWVHRPCDINGDGYVGIDDIFELSLHFGEEPPSNQKYDINGDCTVGIDDIFMISQHFGQEQHP